MTERQPSGSPLNPTFRGYIATTMDALVLFEACLSGRLSHVPRRPHDRERSALIRSGHVFIYEEHSSGIKRWTDGVPWSPSRILGNFLLYRELDKPFQPGEKKRAMKKPKVEGGVSKPTLNAAASRSNSVSSYGTSMPSSSSLSSYENAGSGRDSERALVGSLVDSYQFKSDGLIKKTISVSYRGVQHHLVSYYNIDDVISGRLTTPSATPDFKNLTPRSSLISSGNFRAPVDDHELVVDHGQMAYLAAYNPYIPEYVSMNGINHRSMSVPSIQPYGNWGNMPQQHGLSTNYTMAASPTVPISPGVYQPPPAGQPMGYGYPQSTQQHHAPPSQQHHTHHQPSPHPPPPHAHQHHHQQHQEQAHPVQPHSYSQSISRRQSTAPGNNDGLGFAAMLEGHGPPGVSMGYDPSQSASNGALESDLGLWAGTISEGDHKF
ncbi:Gti1/Pac2 family-domain-containing protein [Microdochium bolleyi]|uniref:Gti1/Pac2 family-domain-containing protein n=1 Tax=Microdochium bolleyi TaxID=196109 RepID=A0A136JBY9_9PEZI|nr:Gti1/Pac2 family-domain-containing protein [Microdochium bolleyi]